MQETFGTELYKEGDKMAIKDFEMNIKNADGSYDILHPITKAKNVFFSNGKNIEQHRTETVTQLISVSRDISIVGKQTISGLLGTPKWIDVFAFVPGTKRFCLGYVDDSSQNVNAFFENAGGFYSLSTDSIALGINSTNFAKAEIIFNSNKTITINWRRNGDGSKSLTAYTKLMIHYHGGD